MTLTNNRYTRLALTLILLMLLSLVLGLFVNVKPVRAVACGPYYLYTYSCYAGCIPWGTGYLCNKAYFERRMPPSDKYVGPAPGEHSPTDKGWTCPANCQ